MIHGIPASLLARDRTRALLGMREDLSRHTPYSEDDPGFRAGVCEHLHSVLLGVTYRRWWSPEEEQRWRQIVEVSGTAEGSSYLAKDSPAAVREVLRLSFEEEGQAFPVEPTPEIVAFLESVPDLEQEINQEARACIRTLGSAKLLRSRPPRLLNWNDTLDTLTVHYLRREGGGQLNTGDAADCVGMADRTLRDRLTKLRAWGLIGAAKSPPRMLPSSRN